MEKAVTAITIFIIMVCLIVAILIKGVTVTNGDKEIVNQHMSWIDFFKLVKQWEGDK